MDDIEWNNSMDYVIKIVEEKKKEVSITKLHSHTAVYCLRILDDLIKHFNDQKIEGYEEDEERKIENRRDWKGDLI